MFQGLCLLSVLLMVAAEDIDVIVSPSQCQGDYNLDSGESVMLHYNGEALVNPCSFSFHTEEIGYELCVVPKEFTTSCDTTIEYYEGENSYTSKAYTCSQNQQGEWCTSYQSLTIIVKGPTTATEDTIQLHIYRKESWDGKEFVDAVRTGIYVIVGIVCLGVVLVIIAVVITVVCCYRRHNASPGSVYLQQQQPPIPLAVVGSQGAYQTQGVVMATGGYQPQFQQMGFQQPPPQAGYQSPLEYQPPQQEPTAGTGYPTQNTAGYQNTQMASDPTM